MICKWQNCRESLENRHLWFGHLQDLEIQEEKVRCKWRNCQSDEVFSYKSHLALHLRKHLAEDELAEKEAKKLAEPDCSKLDKSEGPLPSKIVEEISKYYTCPVTECRTKHSLFSINKHLRRDHRVKIRMMNECPTCSEDILVEELPRHQKTHILENSDDIKAVDSELKAKAINRSSSFNHTLSDEEPTTDSVASPSKRVIFIETEVFTRGDSIICPEESCAKSLSALSINRHCSQFHGGKFVYKAKCKKCDAEMRIDNYPRHLKNSSCDFQRITVKNDSPVKPISPSPNKTRTNCELCGTEMNTTSLRRHMVNVHGNSSLKTSPSNSANGDKTTKRKEIDGNYEALANESPAKQARLEAEGTAKQATTGEKCAFDDDRAKIKSITLKSPNGRYICPVETCEQDLSTTYLRKHLMNQHGITSSVNYVCGSCKEIKSVKGAVQHAKSCNARIANLIQKT